jgi:ferredoxin
VDPACSHCGRCAQACPFGAVNANASTRPLDCAYCQTCASVCPSDAIRFGPRPPTAPVDRLAATGNALSRRAWLGSAAAGAGAALAIRVTGPAPAPLLRPPGSAPEKRFLELCVRCGECFKVCPGSVLQPAGFDSGLEALWTPVVTPTQAGCHQDCNYCTQVCPTGAIGRLSPAQKRKFQIGVARIDPQVCLPHAGKRECQLCYDECTAAGYHAIEMRPSRLAVGEVPAGAFSPEEIEAMSSILAPSVKPEACVGCGLCEYRCHAGPHRRQNLIPRRAIVVLAQTA